MIFDDEEMLMLQRMINQIDDEQTGKVLMRIAILFGLLERKVDENCGVPDDGQSRRDA